MKFRRLGIVLGAILVVSASGVGAALYVQQRLPEPDACSREQLIRWLVLRDLAQEPVEVRHRLAIRLEQEFAQGSMNWQAAGARIDESHRVRLWKNVGLLAEPWFLGKVDQYISLSAQERMAYLDRLLDTLTQWKSVEQLRPSSGQEGASPSFMAQLLQWVRQWQERADPQRRDQIDQFLLAVQARWMMRSIQSAASSSG
jgi:hypothetical protein